MTSRLANKWLKRAGSVTGCLGAIVAVCGGPVALGAQTETDVTWARDCVERRIPADVAGMDSIVRVGRCFLDYKTPITASERHGGNVFHWVLEKMTEKAIPGQIGIEVTRHLFEMGADTWVRDGTGATPLHLAARYGEPGVVAYMLAAGTYVNVVDMKGYTPLHYAARCPPRLPVIALLLDTGAAGKETALDFVKEASCTEKVRHRDGRGREDDEEVSALVQQHNMKSCSDVKSSRKVASDKMTDEEKASRKRASRSLNRTRLHYAAMYSDLNEVLSHVMGRSLESRDVFGRTPLHYAAMNNDVSVIRALTTPKVGLTTADSLGLSPMHLLAGYNCGTVVDSMIGLGVITRESVKAAADTIFGSTPLMWAAGYNHDVSVTESLFCLLHGCDGDGPYHGRDRNTAFWNRERSELGHRPLMWAAGNVNERASAQWVEWGGGPWYRDKNMRTALHWAAAGLAWVTDEEILQDGYEIVRELLSCGGRGWDGGADPRGVDLFGKRAKDYYDKRGKVKGDGHDIGVVLQQGCDGSIIGDDR